MRTRSFYVGLFFKMILEMKCVKPKKKKKKLKLFKRDYHFGINQRMIITRVLYMYIRILSEYRFIRNF